MQYRTQRDKRGYDDNEVPVGPRIVETAGYIPVDKQIQILIDAGRRLDASRGEYEFDADTDVPDSYEDVTRAPGFDMADASSLKAQKSYRLRERLAELNRKKEEMKEEKKAEEVKKDGPN